MLISVMDTCLLRNSEHILDQVDITHLIPNAMDVCNYNTYVGYVPHTRSWTTFEICSL